MSYDVVRTFGADYILFDLIFLAIFLFLLIKYRKKIPLLVFFVGGLGINFVIDWGFWLHSGTREVILPGFLNTVVFFLWFSLSYGVEYAYVFLMFEEKSDKVFWTFLVFMAWIIIGLFSQVFSINDSTIVTIRHMSDFRLLRVGLVLLGYGLLFVFRYDWKKIVYLFLVGFLVHFMMEFSLLMVGIRPDSILILIENSLIEFNMGVPFFYLLYDKFLKKRIR